MKTITKKQEKLNEQNEAIETLKKWIKPGDTVFTILRRVSPSGMTRHISMVIMSDGKPFDVTFYAARAMQDRLDRDTGGIVVGGCGMDMGFHLVYSLSRRLFQDDFECIGENCPANDHSNAYNAEKSGLCMVCRKGITEWVSKKDHKPRYTRLNRNTHSFSVCSKECATGPWKHSDSGYALLHKWL